MFRFAVADATTLERSALQSLPGARMVWLDASQSVSPADLDAVVLTRVTPARLDAAHACLAAGVAVFVANADRLPLDELSRLAHPRCFLLSRRRGSAYFLAARQALWQQRLGRPGLVRLHYWHHDPDHRLVDELDLVLALVGQPVDRVSVSSLALGETVDTGAPRPPQSLAIDGAAAIAAQEVLVHLRFESGAMALIDVQTQPQWTQVYESLSVIGAHGAFYGDDHDNAQLACHDRAMVWHAPPIPHPWAAQLACWIRDPESANQYLKRTDDELAARRLWQLALDNATRDRPQPVAGSLSAVASGEVTNRGDSSRETVSVIAAPHTSERPWRVAVLSVVKHDYIARAFARHAAFELVVVTEDAGQPDWVHERNQTFAAEFGLPYEQHWERALAAFRPDVAVISSEAERHASLAIMAARAGLHVVQDKPMSLDVASGDSVVAAVRAAGVQFMMWNRNFLPAVQQAYAAVQSGSLGRLRAMHVDFYFAKDAGPPLDLTLIGKHPADWLEFLRAAHATGADGSVGKRPMGELECEGIYPLAYLMLISGQQIRSVRAHRLSHFHQLHADHRVDDLASLTLELTDDVLATVCVGRIGRASHPDLGEIKLRLIGTQGSLVVREASPDAALDYRGRSPHAFRRQRIDIDSDWQLVDNFAQSLRGQSRPMIDVEQSRHIVAVIEACLRDGAFP